MFNSESSPNFESKRSNLSWVLTLVVFMIMNGLAASGSLTLKTDINDLYFNRDVSVSQMIFPDIHFESPVTDSPIFLKFGELPSGLTSSMVPPYRVAEYSGSISTYDVVFREDLLYTTCGYSGYYIFNVADRNQIVRIGFITSGGYRSMFNSILDGNYSFYAADGDGLRIADISHPDSTSVVEVYENQELLEGYLTYNERDRILFQSVYYEGVIEVLDMDDPLSPTSITVIDTLSDYTKRSVLSEDYSTFIASASTDYYIYFYNVSDPFNIEKISNISGTDALYIESMLVYNDSLLYIGRLYSRPFLVIDYSDVEHPEVIHRISDICTSVNELKIIGNLLLFSCEGEGVKIFNISNPINPVMFLEYVNDRSDSLEVEGNHIFIARYDFGVETVRFGDTLISGVPTTCGDYEIEVFAEDVFGNSLPIDEDFSFYIRVRDDYAYFDSECSVFMCNGTFSNDTSSALCSGHGDCTFQGSRTNGICVCDGGYYHSNNDDENPCSNYNCGFFSKYDSKVCGGHGKCESLDLCECTDDYEGFECQTFSCGYDKSDPRTCRGNGDCVAPKVCECKSLYTGDECETNVAYSAIMAPILSIFGTLVIACLCCVFAYVFACGILCCLALAVLVFSSSGLFAITRFQKFRMKKFEEIKDIDLILAEQKSESSFAHLRINRNLFKIEMSELRVNRILGEGGSHSVVFQATWKKTQKVAFKCFKTRHILGNYEDYREFEREVEVMASVGHPNIIRFFGATLKPPRVGIVMEYCEHGDLNVFISNFFQSYGTYYPLEEKLRMLLEIISSMEYLHSRNIIHRDLKLENILVDSQITCKLVDFGLSKIVKRMSQVKTKKIGTSFYMAPELVLHGFYDEKVDVYSFGILVWILMTEKIPYDENENFEYIEMVVANDPKVRPSFEILKETLHEEYGIQNVPEEDTKTTPGGKSGAESINKVLDWVMEICGSCWCHESAERWSFPQLHDYCSEKIKELEELQEDGSEVLEGSEYMKKRDAKQGKEDDGDEEEGMKDRDEKYVEEEEDGKEILQDSCTTKDEKEKELKERIRELCSNSKEEGYVSKDDLLKLIQM